MPSVRLGTQRIDAIALSSSGVLVAHQAAYSLADLLGYGSDVGHGHLGTLWKISLLAAVVAMTSLVLRSLRGRRYHLVRPVSTAAVMAIGFTGLEFFERILSGYSPTALFSEVVFWLEIGRAHV